jgi:3-methylcrotonyl-CoA carboxylase alpha subunit
MGDKERARKIAAEAGVPVLPASRRFREGETEGLLAEAAAVGYPLLVKAAAGGGGIGMSRVDTPEELPRVVAATQSMAGKAFGDASVYLERYVARARHVEVQVFGFGGGAGVHLFDRDCSVQRRFQKIIEEAPAPDLPDELRQRLLDASVALVRHQRYEGAGTVEFIHDTETRQAYFLEMNTRIQVEHPVTEMITGIDLVAWQIRQALGQLAPVAQSEIRAQGHAIECRLYAERPERNFLPAPGTISDLVWPATGAGLRIDAGVRAGDKVTPYYDPMVGKIIAHGPNRNAARARLQAALGDLVIEGLRTNRDFLQTVLADPDFAAARVSTGLVADVQARTAATAAPTPAQ